MASCVLRIINGERKPLVCIFTFLCLCTLANGGDGIIKDEQGSCCCPCSASSPLQSDAGDTEASTILSKMLTHMDPRIRPDESGPPVKVVIECHVISIGSINEVSMDYKADILLHQKWTDPRLTFKELNHPKPLTLTHGIHHEIWKPDVFFPNEIDAQFHDVTVPNQLVKIYPNGSVEYALRITLHSTCPMDLRYFPLDKQECQLKLESFSYEDTDLTLEWSEDRPVTIEPDTALPEMELVKVMTSECTRVYKIGSYHCLKITFCLQRHYGYYVLQTYIPSILITVLSWVSFWINKEAVPARISLGVLTVLTMTTQLSGSKTELPKVSYPKAIDVWMSTCMFFVFAALLEYAIINALMRNKNRPAPIHSDSDHAKQTEKYRLHRQHECVSETNGPVFKPKRNTFVYIGNDDTPQMLDNICRFAFPCCFILFNAIYWSMYLKHPEAF